MFTGYAFLDSPAISLFENGFQSQAGVRPRTWYSLGFDYSISAGNLTITPNLLTTALQQQLGAQLAPSGKKTDWTVFYGFGGGTDLLFSKHVALRVQADLVYDHLFSDLLQNGRWTVRFGVGPCFNFGKNIVK